MKTTIQLIAIIALVLGASSALAFHDGGVAYCAGCHTMHNSQDGAAIPGNTPTGSPYLLIRANSTDVCLTCHADYGQMADGNGWGAGGDFYWMTKTYTWTFPWGGGGSSAADAHGHNVISPEYGIIADATLGTAPGGTFDSDYLTCTSCHDPHGQDNFRILYGSITDPLGPAGPIYGNSRFTFTELAPLALGNSRVTNHTNSHGAEPETDAAHTVYKSGMSDWCANCHTTIHDANTTNIVHPTGFGIDGLADIYNAYVTTTDQTGVKATAYNALVPIEKVNVDLTAVDTMNDTDGAAAGDQVMCLSCHRAHASAFDDATRWDMHADLLVDSHPTATDGGSSVDDATNKYYGRDWTAIDANQRSLCNKCHYKDFGDHNPN